ASEVFDAGMEPALRASRPDACSVGQRTMRRRATMVSSRLKFALALLTAVTASGAVGASAATTTTTTLPCGYPLASPDPRPNVALKESDVLRAFSPFGTVTATPGLTIKVWYNDEHALTLGVRQVIVKSKTGTTTTNYPFAALTKVPMSVLYPQVGTTALDGDQ